LRAAAAAQADVAATVAGLGAGAALASAGADLGGLMSEDACHLLGAAVENAVTGVHDDLSTHSTSLSTAADHYYRTDQGLGRRLQRFTE
jgi:hypothetical protein